MKCCLWLNGRKICNASEIRGNFDLFSLRGYFLGGSLIPWLDSNGGKFYAKRLLSLKNKDYLSVNNIIKYAFYLKKLNLGSKKIFVKNKTPVKFECHDNSVFFSENFGSFGSLSSFNSFYSFYSFYYSFGSGKRFLDKYGYGVYLI